MSQNKRKPTFPSFVTHKLYPGPLKSTLDTKSVRFPKQKKLPPHILDGIAEKEFNTKIYGSYRNKIAGVCNECFQQRTTSGSCGCY